MHLNIAALRTSRSAELSAPPAARRSTNQFATVVHVLENLHKNRRLADRSKLLSPSCVAIDPTPISPRGRRSRPLQRGATECQAWNERVYLAAVLRLRLRRAEKYVGLGFAMARDSYCVSTLYPVHTDFEMLRD